MTMTYDQVAQLIIDLAISLGLDPVPPLSTAIQESGLRPDAVSPNGLWRGIYQQDSSYTDRDNPTSNVNQFFARLVAKRSSAGWSSDLWLNIFWLQQRPSEPSAAQAYANGRKAYLTEIKSRTAEAQRLVRLYAPNTGELVSNVIPAARPDFNEYADWTRNNHARSLLNIDLFLLHTQEGGGGDNAARDLSALVRSTEGGANPVSYHYYISQASDGGVTVIDGVDTDYASWSVGNSNGRSINLCFAGSRASWTRDQWLQHSNAIDVAAYLAVQDCRKYNIPIRVLTPPYGAPGGISDHRYCGQYLKDGNNHTDVGGPMAPPWTGFPWDFFSSRVDYWAKATSGELPPITDTPVETPAEPSLPVASMPADAQREILAQTRGRWEMLGWRTPVEAMAVLLDAVTGSNNAGKRGFRW